MSLRGKLLASYVAVVVLALAVAGAYAVRRIEAHYTRSYAASLEAQARIVAEALRPHLARHEDYKRLEQIAKAYQWRKGVYVGVRDPSGTKPHLGPSQPPPPPEVLQARQGQVATAVRWDPQAGETRIFAAAPVLERGRLVGIVHVSAPRLWVERQLQQIWWAFGVAGALALAAATFLGLRISRSITRPLRALEAGAQAISRGEYGRQVPVERGDEVGRLAQAFNRMAQQLAETIERIRAERNRLEAVLASLRDAVVAMGPQGELLLCNRAAKELLGVSQDSIGRPLREVLHLPQLLSLLEAAAAGREQSEELQLLDGRVAQVTCSPIRGDKTPAGAVAVVRDVTDLHRSERLRRELVANVSHELRTPLTSIKGFVETLLAGALRDEVHSRRFLEIIEAETNRLTKLVDDLLELSRLESKGVTFRLQPVDLGELATRVVARHQPRAEATGIQLECRAEAGVVAAADPDRIEQVLTNLLDNALKFTPEGGRIHVSVRQQGQEAFVAVEDTGRGIPPEDLPHVFERFYRADRSRTRTRGGSGLGLAIAKQLVEMQGGRISATSRPGHGSVFAFWLPLTREPLTSSEQPGGS